ncbi:MAG: YchJ family protein [Desulfobacteraceae bacterium]|nr:YchJ family protein [Desulfobacteraceae bacterium]
MEQCPCGSGRTYAECCQPLIQATQPATTAEALMRSRYTAHVKAEIDYIVDTTHPSKRGSVNRKEVTDWAHKAEWQSFEVLQTEAGGAEDSEGCVEFVAAYRQKEKLIKHHEIAEFKKVEGRWYFFDGKAPRPQTIVRQGPKLGRNDPCSCGSGKKFKKCCGA